MMVPTRQLFHFFWGKCKVHKPLPISEDGLQKRDFTFFSYVVQADILSSRIEDEGDILNIRDGVSHSTPELAKLTSREKEHGIDLKLYKAIDSSTSNSKNMGKKSRRKKVRKQIMKEPSSVDSIGYASKKKDRNSDGALALLLIKIIRWGAYIALFAPLVIHAGFFFPFVVPKTVFFWMFAEVIFAAWVLLAISNKQFRPKWNFLSVSLGVFMLVTIFTSFIGVNIERSFWSTFERMAGTINWIHLALFFSALAFTFKTVGEWRKLLSASFIAASIVAIIFILDQKFGVSIIPFETRGGATIGNSSFMAAYLLFNVFFGVWLVSVAKKGFVKILYATALAAIVSAVFNSTAYGALLSMLGGFFIIFLAWIFFTQRIKFARTIVVSMLLASVLIGGVVVWGTFAQNDRILRKLPYFFSNAGTIGARRVIWDIAWQGVKERPILGWGAENFNVVFTKYFNPCLPISECGGGRHGLIGVIILFLITLLIQGL